MSDLSIVYYTANKIPEDFAKSTRHYLKFAAQDIPIVTVPLPEGVEPSHIGIYEQALEGAVQAETKYIALAEDDVLYSPEHFKHRPSPGKFAYNLGCWSIFTWSSPPVFTHKGTVRRNLSNLICERDLFIAAMMERFANGNLREELWGEPGKYEEQLGVTVRETEEFYTNPPNIVFSHETALSFKGLGTRKRIGEFRAYDIPYWGKASDVVKLYK